MRGRVHARRTLKGLVADLRELKENGFTRDDFSAEELKDLKDEIKDRLENPDGFMLDGFWSSEGPGLRRQFEKEIGLWPKK